MESSVDIFKKKVDDLKKDSGLVDLKFFPGAVSESVPEQFCAEANKFIDAVMSGKGEPLIFSDEHSVAS